MLFETMAFCDSDEDFEEDQQRYCTWDEAIAGHEEMCAKYRTKVGAQ